jgi:hypothetical protein
MYHLVRYLILSDIHHALGIAPLLISLSYSKPPLSASQPRSRQNAVSMLFPTAQRRPLAETMPAFERSAAAVAPVNILAAGEGGLADEEVIARRWLTRV